MIPNIYKKIFEALVKKSTAKELKWYDTQFGYSVSFRTVSIDMVRNNENSFELHIFNPSGERIDSFNILSNEDEFSFALELWDIARRQVNQVDETIEELEEELGIRPKKERPKKDKPAPPPPKPPGGDDDLPF